MWLAEYSGLMEFWDLFMRAINISPLDGDSNPSVSMLPSIMGEIKQEEREEFWQCVELSMIRFREMVSIERKKAIEKIKNKRK